MLCAQCTVNMSSMAFRSRGVLALRIMHKYCKRKFCAMTSFCIKYTGAQLLTHNNVFILWTILILVLFYVRRTLEKRISTYICSIKSLNYYAIIRIIFFSWKIIKFFFCALIKYQQTFLNVVEILIQWRVMFNKLV